MTSAKSRPLAARRCFLLGSARALACCLRRLRRKKEAGMAGRSEIRTMFNFIDADEGREQ